MIFFLPQSHITQSGSFTQTPDRIDRNNHTPISRHPVPSKRFPLSFPVLIWRYYHDFKTFSAASTGKAVVAVSHPLVVVR
jgi:hypothetical protein